MAFGGELQANTAVDLIVGPFVDDTDGKTAETGLTITQAEVRLSKNGGNMAQKNEATSLAHDELGSYLCKLDATDTNTEGILSLMIHESGALPVKMDYMVLAQAAYISKYTAKDAGFMDVNIKSVGRADAQETEANNLESACSNYSAERGLTGTALPAAAADAAGGVPVSDAGGLDMDNLKTEVDGLQGTDGKCLISTDAQDLSGTLDVNAKALGGTVQSATDLKDFADAGYDPATNKVQGVVLTDTCTTNIDVRGTDNAALASVVGALNDAAAAGDPTANDTVMQYIKQLINVLIGTTGIGAFPAEAAPANAVSLAEVIHAIHDDVTGLAGSAMRGTDSAATAANLTTAQNDLDILTGADGATLATSQPNYAPALASGVDVTKIHGTALTETSAGNLAGNFTTFYDNADAATAKTVDDVGGASGLEVDVTKIHGSALTEGAGGQLAAGFTKFYDVATPTKDINDVGAVASGGVPRLE